MVGPSAKRTAIRAIVASGVASQRRVCLTLGVPRSSVRYKPKRREGEESLRERIKKLAKKHSRYGYRRIWATLRREGREVNIKRVHRLWREESLQIRRTPRKKRHAPVGEVTQKAQYPNHVWTYDIVHDSTEKGKPIKVLNVLDEYTREALAQEVEPSISAAKVVSTLRWLFLLYGPPEYIRSDNGGEFIAGAVKEWLNTSGCTTIYIEPGSPWENPYIESFNGKFRDECLNREVFINGAHARAVIENWRMEYNTQRPHSSLGYLTPAEFRESSKGAATGSRLPV